MRSGTEIKFVQHWQSLAVRVTAYQVRSGSVFVSRGICVSTVLENIFDKMSDASTKLWEQSEKPPTSGAD